MHAASGRQAAAAALARHVRRRRHSFIARLSAPLGLAASIQRSITTSGARLRPASPPQRPVKNVWNGGLLAPTAPQLFAHPALLLGGGGANLEASTGGSDHQRMHLRGPPNRAVGVAAATAAAAVSPL